MTTYNFTWRPEKDGDIYEMGFVGFDTLSGALAAWSRWTDLTPDDCVAFKVERGADQFTIVDEYEDAPSLVGVGWWGGCDCRTSDPAAWDPAEILRKALAS